MASPIKTWTSVLLGIAVAYFLFFNIAQIVDNAKMLSQTQGIVNMATEAAMDMETEIAMGMTGTGVLIALYIVATLAIFLNKEKPVLTKSQLTCYIMMGVMLLIAFLTSAMALVELYGHVVGKPKTVFIVTLAMAAFRLLLLGGILGCGVHAIRNN
jgi:hypothetical protein